MPVIVREGSWRVWIYTNDHAPPHVHVNRYSAALKVQLPTESEPARILRRRGLTDREAIAALRLVEQHAAQLTRAWRAIHGVSQAD